MKHYQIMAAIAAIASVPLLYVACISAIVGNHVAGTILATIGTALAGLAATYESRYHRLREWLGSR